MIKSNEPLDKIFTDIQIALREIESMREKIAHDETFGGAYGFIDQEADLVYAMWGSLRHHRTMVCKLKNRMATRIQQYEKSTKND